MKRVSLFICIIILLAGGMITYFSKNFDFEGRISLGTGVYEISDFTIVKNNAYILTKDENSIDKVYKLKKIRGKWKSKEVFKSEDDLTIISAADDGGLIVGGSVEEQPIGNSPGNKIGLDAIVLKINESGKVLWKVTVGGNSVDYFNRLEVLKDGGILAAGYSSSSDGDFSKLNPNKDSQFIVKFNSSGRVIWKRILDIESTSRLVSIDTNEKNVFSLVYDRRIQKYNSSGNLISEEKIRYPKSYTLEKLLTTKKQEHILLLSSQTDDTTQISVVSGFKYESTKFLKPKRIGMESVLVDAEIHSRKNIVLLVRKSNGQVLFTKPNQK